MATDVPEGKGPKHGIHQGMHQDIRIAMAIESKSVGMLQADAPEDQWTTLHQAMNVIAVTNPQIHGCSSGSHRHSPVFQAGRPFGSAPLQPAGIEVGATQTGALLALLLAPSFNGPMIATAENFGHFLAPKQGGAGVLGMFQQAIVMALLQQRSRFAHRARQLANNTIDHSHGRQFTPGQDKITQRDLLICKAANALVKAFVMATEQHQLVVVLGPSQQICLPQGLTLGTHQQDTAAHPHWNRLKGSKNRLGLEHHAHSAPVGQIIDLAIAIRGVITGVMGVEFSDAGSKGTSNHPKLPKGLESLR